MDVSVGTNLMILLTNLSFIFKVGFVILAILYFIFSLIVVRQVNLMTETIITEAAGILRFLSFIHALFALGIVILFVLLLH